jgi:aminoglycoside phosphotransferase
MPTFGFLAPNIDFSVLDVSDRYNNLKMAWDSLAEAANHGHPHAFQVAVTVVLEQLKREQQKKQRKD